MVKSKPVTSSVTITPKPKLNIFKPEIVTTFEVLKGIETVTQQEQKKYKILDALLKHTLGARSNILPPYVKNYLDTLWNTCGGIVIQFKNLVISIIDIIHDADKSRTLTPCSILPLFITTVCAMYGMPPAVYDYIRKNVVPITTKVLTMYVKSSPPTKVDNVNIYFARVVTTYLLAAGGAAAAAAAAAAAGIPLETVLTQGLTPADARLYLQAVLIPDNSITIRLIRDNTGISKDVSAALTHARVNFIDEVTGSVLLDSVSTPKSDTFDTDLQTWVRANRSITVANTLVPGNVTVNFRHFPNQQDPRQEAYRVSVQYPVGTTNHFFWYPDPGTGYPRVNCSNAPSFTVTHGTSPLPPNDTKNCAIKLAAGMGGYRAFNVQLAATRPANVSYANVHTDLTPAQLVLYKAMGDCSYVLFNLGGSLRYVTTSDIISALRLTEGGFQVIIGLNDGQQVFYTTINFNTEFVDKELEKIIANIFTSGIITRISAKKKVTDNTTLRIQGPVTRSTTLNTGTMTRSKSALLTRLQFNKIVNAFGLGIRGGQIQPVENPFDNNDNYFSNTLFYLAQLPEFCNFKFSTYQEDQHEKRVINSESEEMFMLLSNFKTIISNFGKKLEKFKNDKTVYLVKDGTVNYWYHIGTVIVNYLEAIFAIMSSNEVIETIKVEFEGKDYSQCVKNMNLYMLMFPLIYDEIQNRWYFNYIYPFSIYLSEYVQQSITKFQPESPDTILSANIRTIKEFVSAIPTITKSEDNKETSFNTSLLLTIRKKCQENDIQNNTGSLQKFTSENDIYRSQSNLKLKDIGGDNVYSFLKTLTVSISDEDFDNIIYIISNNNTDIEALIQRYVEYNNIPYEEFIKKFIDFIIENNDGIKTGIFSFINFVLYFQNFDNIGIVDIAVLETIIQNLLDGEYKNKSYYEINDNIQTMCYYSNLNNFFYDKPEIVEKIIKTRNDEGFTSIDQLSILEQNISILCSMYNFSLSYAESKFYDNLSTESVDFISKFETVDKYVEFEMGKLQEYINEEVKSYLNIDELLKPNIELTPHVMAHVKAVIQNALGVETPTVKNSLNYNSPPYVNRPLVSPVGAGGKNNRISNPKQNTKYRKKYKKFVSKYIIKKKKNKKNNNKNKNNKKNNKNKTRKNKRLTKSTPNSKRNNKTLKNKKSKSKLKLKPNKHKSKQNNNKTKTNYYNLYKHNKTLKH
jgi:hypothetical protein